MPAAWREYEPDKLNYTPRISSVLHPDGSFELSTQARVTGAGAHASSFCARGHRMADAVTISTYRVETATFSQL